MVISASFANMTQLQGLKNFHQKRLNHLPLLKEVAKRLLLVNFSHRKALKVHLKLTVCIRTTEACKLQISGPCSRPAEAESRL